VILSVVDTPSCLGKVSDFNPTGGSSVGACVPHFDEYAVYVI
jgi:hypothetical protein